jgi:uncharacterized membrane protein
MLVGRSVYLFLVWLHVLSAITWIGAACFLAFVLGPVLRRPEFRGQYSALMQFAGERMRIMGWVCLATLVGTGVLLLGCRGYHWADFFSGAMFACSAGHVIALKLLTVLAILVLSVVHDFIVGPHARDAMRDDPGSPRTAALRRQAALMGRLSLVLGLFVLACAVAIVRGGW